MKALRFLALAIGWVVLGTGTSQLARADALGIATGNYAISFDINDDGSVDGSGSITIGIDEVTAFDVSFPGISLQCSVCDVLASNPDLVTQNIPGQFVIQDTVPGELAVLGILQFESAFALQVKDLDNVITGVWSATSVNQVAEPASVFLLMIALAGLGWSTRISTRRRSFALRYKATA